MINLEFKIPINYAVNIEIKQRPIEKKEPVINKMHHGKSEYNSTNTNSEVSQAQ